MEAILARGGITGVAASSGGGSDPGTGGSDPVVTSAQIEVTAPIGANVTCVGGSVNTQRSCITGTVVFNVGYGTYTLSSTFDGETTNATVVVNEMKIYAINLAEVRNIFGIKIDCSNSDPTNACTYTNDAASFTPLSCAANGARTDGSWTADVIRDILGVRPCLYKKGSAPVYLNPNNFGQKEDGTSADITSGNAGDVMIEFAKRWYRYRLDGNNLYFEFATYNPGEGWSTAAFKSEDGNATDVDAFYYGAYDGWLDSGNKLRSLSGKEPKVSYSFNDFVTAAGRMGSGHTIETFYKRMYICGLLMLVIKSRDAQAKIGNGRVNSNSAKINTGTMDTKGMFYGRPGTDTEGCKAFGIENFWGNIWKWMAGLMTIGANGALGIKAASPFPTSSPYTGYTQIQYAGSTNTSQWPTKMSPAGDGAVALPATLQTDGTKGWPDYFYVDKTAGYISYVGGHWSSALTYSGPFARGVNNTPSDTYDDIGGRLAAA